MKFALLTLATLTAAVLQGSAPVVAVADVDDVSKLPERVQGFGGRCGAREYDEKGQPYIGVCAAPFGCTKPGPAPVAGGVCVKYVEEGESCSRDTLRLCKAPMACINASGEDVDGRRDQSGTCQRQEDHGNVLTSTTAVAPTSTKTSTTTAVTPGKKDTDSGMMRPPADSSDAKKDTDSGTMQPPADSSDANKSDSEQTAANGAAAGSLVAGGALLSALAIGAVAIEVVGGIAA